MNCRGTFAEIDLKAIKHNLSILRKHCGNSKILMAVKADAYGHGAIEISGFCENEKLTDVFGVASIEEGRELRKAGIKSNILILGLILHDTNCIMEAVDKIKGKIDLQQDYPLDVTGCSLKEQFECC